MFLGVTHVYIDVCLIFFGEIGDAGVNSVWRW